MTIQSATMVHACNRPLQGVKVSNHAGVFTQPLAGTNSRWRIHYDDHQQHHITGFSHAALHGCGSAWSLGGFTRMVTQQLQEIERAVGIRYPLSFVSMFEEFSALLGTDGFRRAFADACLLFSAPEIVAARENIPAALLPFMREEQPTWPDIFAFDLDSGGPEFRVVVWSDHAIVMDWESFPVFFQWVRERIAKHDTAAS